MTTNSLGERGAGDGRGGSGGRGRSGRRWHRGQRVPSLITQRFKGRCAELGRHVYDNIDASQAALDYINTTKKISEYIGRHFEHGIDIKKIIDSTEMTALDKPEDLSDEDKKSESMKEIWRRQIDAFVKHSAKRIENIQKACV